MSFSTKYRPQTFDDVVEQSHIIAIIKQQLWQQYIALQEYQKNGGLFPAAPNYLLYGPRWTWKTTTARLIATWLNIKRQEGEPDMTDDILRVIQSGQTMDIIEIDAASHTWVQNIRDEILDKALYSPTDLTHKVYIIDEVHMLSTWAFNALLKIMEDKKSAPYLTFVLATTEIHKVPETIISRCHVFNFKKLSLDSMAKRLEYITKKESLTASHDALMMIAQLADGALRDAEKYLEQVSVLWEISVESVSQFLWVTTQGQRKSFVDVYAAWDIAAQIDFVTELDTQWVDLQQFARQVLQYCDECFSDDIDLYSRLSMTMTQVDKDMRHYPHALLAFKVILATVWQWVVTPQSMSQSSQNVVKTQSSWISAMSQTKKNLETKNNQKWENDQKTEKKDSLKTASQNETKTQDIWQNVWQNISASSDNIDKEQLLAQLIDGLWSASFQKLLSNATITTINDESVTIVVLSPIAKMQLEKKDYREKAEKTLNTIIWRPLQLIVESMTKEAFMQQQLLGDL